MPNQSPMRIRLSAERRATLLVLDFFVRELGPPVYNQGVRDACGYIQEKLSDIEGDIYERESKR
jgi:uncharacterized protein (DUF2164 family)